LEDSSTMTEPATPVYCASVVYPPDAVGFDFEYLRSRHAPMFAEMLGENCERFEVHRPIAAPDAPPPPFAGAAYFWVTSPERFGAALQEHGQQLYADIANFSQTAPTRGWAQLV
jgi:uncharacterized protein (TIGR02118 family)